MKSSLKVIEKIAVSHGPSGQHRDAISQWQHLVYPVQIVEPTSRNLHASSSEMTPAAASRTAFSNREASPRRSRMRCRCNVGARSLNGDFHLASTVNASKIAFLPLTPVFRQKSHFRAARGNIADRDRTLNARRGAAFNRSRIKPHNRAKIVTCT